MKQEDKLVKGALKKDSVKIQQIAPTGSKTIDPIFGLGSDEVIYVVDENTATPDVWRVHIDPRPQDEAKEPAKEEPES